MIVFVDQNATSDGRDAAFESSAVAIALLLVLGPWAWRLAAERDAERTARIRSQERAEMAARVHDSVLQTLALVQREADDPRRVAALARRQERELRAWLYPDPRARRRRASAPRSTRPRPRSRSCTASRSSSSAPATCRSTTGSRRSSSPRARRWRTRPQHSGADEVSAFVDVGDDEIAVFVRDRGTRLRPGRGAAGRARDRRVDPRPHGARRRHRRRSSSSPEGTEVELRLGRQA